MRVRIHSLDHARAALSAAAGAPVVLESPPAAAGNLGVGWWREVLRLTAAEFPGTPFEAVLDCGDAPGHALAAIRAGVPAIRLDAEEPVRARVAAIAAQADTILCGTAGEDLVDLLAERDPEAACRAIR